MTKEEFNKLEPGSVVRYVGDNLNSLYVDKKFGESSANGPKVGEVCPGMRLWRKYKDFHEWWETPTLESLDGLYTISFIGTMLIEKI